MEQLLLDLDQLMPVSPRLENFVVGDNRELMTTLAESFDLHAVLSSSDESEERDDEALQADTVKSQPRYTLWYLFGAGGAGKTHLLKSMACYMRGIYRDIREDPAMSTLTMDDETSVTFIALDNVDALSDTGQERVFHLCNQAQRGKMVLMLAASKPPSALSFRKDLQLRFAQGLVFQLSALSDEQKMAALKNYVKARAMTIQDEVLSYLLSHASRNLSSLIALLDNIDHISLKQQQRPTLPMVRQVLSEIQKRESC